MAAPSEATVIRRISGLLAKAEATDNPHEAEAFSARAFQLMDKYRIDRAKVQAATGTDEPVGGVRYPLYRHKYLRASLHLLAAVCQHYSCMVIVGRTGNSKEPHLVGHVSDVEAVVMMFRSLIIQRDRACLKSTSFPGTNANQHRNSFCYGYALRIAGRLEEIRAARQPATDDATSQALAVIDRRLVRVQEVLDGKVSQNSQNAPKLDMFAAADGVTAADSADLGVDARVGGSGAKALGGGS